MPAGALAFGIGTSEVEHVLATQTLLQSRSLNMRVQVDGPLGEGVTAKDVVLHIASRFSPPLFASLPLTSSVAQIGEIGTAGGTGAVIEFCGTTIESLSIEGRCTVANMSIEGGARAGMVAPDEITFEYLKGRPLAPKGADWDAAVAYWKVRSNSSDFHRKFRSDFAFFRAPFADAQVGRGRSLRPHRQDLFC